MKKTESLKKRKDFRRMYGKGRSLADSNLVMYILKNDNTYNRLGISVSKKVGNSVVRSRVTRLIRESYRLNEDLINTGYDLVVIARVNSKGKSYHDISKSLIHLLRRHGLINR
ncbi:ribonuclease P protein component [Vallitalea okinawensis]|uniref:ribonuclease P protein component n=1 Tax=Vallitalea okinawensis TaxID=2078660 RepID=UPI000CFDDC70|nr:ribonuclease P protein component [Vallitalea okinawensis]